MKTKAILTVIGIYLLTVVVSCSQKETQLTIRTPHLPGIPYIYTDSVPAVISTPWGGGSTDNTPPNNPTTNAGAALGRVLFYERVLSINNAIACGSCHKQEAAFADNGAAFSQGYQGRMTARNSIGVWNERMNNSFFFDGRAKTLEEQTMMPVENHIEMGMESIDALPKKLSALSYYAPLFKAAFGTTDITPQRISYALAQFMRSMNSLNSKFDEGSQNGFSNFTPVEKDGMKFFTEFRCGNCHNGPNFNGGGFDFANIGLDVAYSDKGLMNITGQPTDEGRFKIPSLRNVVFTAPYMHDGRYKTLDEVLNHYGGNIQPDPNLDFRLTNGGWVGIFVDEVTPTTDGNVNGFVPEGGAIDIVVGSNSTGPVVMNISPYQKQAIIAFLNTLTDWKYTRDERFADPFQ